MTRPISYAVATTYADACQTLHDKIAARYGYDALDTLTFQMLPCPHKGAATSGSAILAYPTGEPLTRDNLIVSYYGDAIHAA